MALTSNEGASLYFGIASFGFTCSILIPLYLKEK